MKYKVLSALAHGLCWLVVSSLFACADAREAPCAVPARCPADAALQRDATTETGPLELLDTGSEAIVAPDVLPTSGSFCSLPGSVVWTGQGSFVVPGGAPQPDIGWLTLPQGFCAHYFGNVADARQLRFSPDGKLFVASPTTGTTGGNPSGAMAAIAMLPDDNHDGVSDTTVTFLDQLPSIQGLLFANNSLYYQDDVTIRSVPYTTGDLRARSPSQVVTKLDETVAPQASEHWPKVMDISQDGTIYISNGGSQSDTCMPGAPARGAIFSLQPDGGLSVVARGFRNPIALRCETNHNVCMAVELALDYAYDVGREKLVPIRPGDDWGYPCCATRNVPYAGVTYPGGAKPDCSQVAADTDSFLIAHTPFGVDFETGKWPAPWGGRAYVTLHGVIGSWEGARVVAIGVDSATGLPLAATELDGGGPNPDSMLQFAGGWDDKKQDHGRPAPVAFAPDGRLFLGDDQKGLIVWIAPVDLAVH